MQLLLLLSAPQAIVDQYLSGIRRAAPGLEINWVSHHNDVDPFIGDADILFTFGPLMADHVLAKATNLKWIQALGSGVDGITDQPSLRGDIVVTNGWGVQATPVSEAALAFMFALSRRLPQLLANQAARTWDRWPSQTLNGCTVGVLGVGAIAEALAPKCKALGMTVVGISSAPRALANFDRVAHRDDLAEVVADLDYLVLLTPLTAQTRNIVGREVLQAMKPSAFLINLARGGVVDEDALIEALRGGGIKGAALDVFVDEPLPADHPLWATPNLIISPHLGGLNDRYVADLMPTLAENLDRFLGHGRTDLLNVVRPG